MMFLKDKIRVACETLYAIFDEKVADITEIEYAPCGYKTTPLPPSDTQWKPFNTETPLEGMDCHFWFRFNIRTPKKCIGKKFVLNIKTGKEGHWDATNPQCIVYFNEKIVQGADVNHAHIPLEPEKDYEVLIYFYTGMEDASVRFIPSVIARDEKILGLYYDLAVPYMSLDSLDPNSQEYIDILTKLDIALQYLDLRVLKSKEFYDSCDKVSEYLYRELYTQDNHVDAIVNCIGHTHIDVAWKWTVAQTVEKAQRSFATVLNLMEQYPEYKFTSSQPQLYQYVKEEAPELYERIKKAVKDKRWEVEGAMWLEADCNLTSGESLVRQILFGKRFMKEEFDVDSKILWLPDVFGYSAALPQILKKCGVDKFVTDKISWNESNRMPYDTFMWQGIDGSEIFTYFMSSLKWKDKWFCTYNGTIMPDLLHRTWNAYRPRAYNNEVLLSYGYGDGGGGPSAEMLEINKRISKGIPGIPKTKLTFAADVLEKAEKNFMKNSELFHDMPKWVGELYLEFHRGTYTSMARNKKFNRKSELGLQMTEALCVTNKLLTDTLYPQEKINETWKTVLLNQFHDILPGSSIKEVYEVTDKEYAQVLSTVDSLSESAFDSLAKNINTDGGVLVYNPNGFVTDGVIDLDGKKQFVENIPAMGYKVVAELSDTNTIKVSNREIENKFYILKFDYAGNIISLYDKTACRELASGKLNELQVFEDFPKAYDAWEISEYYKQKMYLIDDVVSIEKVDEGTRAGLKITKKYLSSTVTQTIYVYENTRNIDFETVADWKESHMLLKAAFPMDLHVYEATYDIQFGSLKRPTHKNTSWDRAKFEVCGHKWADLSEDDYGVSLLNDCKYGYSAEGSTLKLTLIKCATYPNPDADREVHKFTYSLYPHLNDFKRGGTIQAAYLLNQPLIAKPVSAQDGILADNFSLVSADRNNVIIETAKKAEDSDDLIIRMYDAYDRRENVTLNFGFDIKKAYICDMLEHNVTELDINGREVSVPVSNFEIVTLKVVPA